MNKIAVLSNGFSIYEENKLLFVKNETCKEEKYISCDIIAKAQCAKSDIWVVKKGTEEIEIIDSTHILNQRTTHIEKCSFYLIHTFFRYFVENGFWAEKLNNLNLNKDYIEHYGEASLYLAFDYLKTIQQSIKKIHISPKDLDALFYEHEAYDLASHVRFDIVELIKIFPNLERITSDISYSDSLYHVNNNCLYFFNDLYACPSGILDKKLICNDAKGICSYALMNMTNVMEFEGENITKIFDEAFIHNQVLQKIHVNKDVMFEGTETFRGCSHLSNNDFSVTQFRILYGYNKRRLPDAFYQDWVRESNCDSTKKPLACGNCGKGAFWAVYDNSGSKELHFLGKEEGKITIPPPPECLCTNIVFHEGIAEIGDNVFDYFTYTSVNCETMLLSSTIKSLGKDAFVESSFDLLMLPETIEEIKESCFFTDVCHNKTLVVSLDIPKVGLSCFHNRAGSPKQIVLMGMYPFPNIVMWINSSLFFQDSTYYYPKQWKKKIDKTFFNDLRQKAVSEVSTTPKSSHLYFSGYDEGTIIKTINWIEQKISTEHSNWIPYEPNTTPWLD